ncbi:MAG: DUF4097 domain-containing protein [Lachnospiraceae bacterium]|nr:DUF4097 domain-containing protein [Lachnospiraceae bacterium]
MNTFERIIKYCAMAFAVVLSIGIFGGIAAALTGVASNGTVVLFGESSDEDLVSFTKEFEGVEELDLHNYSGHMTVQIGEGFSVDAKNVRSDYVAEMHGNKLYVGNENDSNFIFNFEFFSSSKRSEVVVTVPASFVAEKAEFSNGSGEFDLQYLNTDVMTIENGSGRFNGNDMTAERTTMDLGSGAVEITNLTSGRTSITGGSGSLTMSSCSIEDLSGDMGSGRFTFDGELKGKNDLETGSGNVVLNIMGNIKDYGMDCDAGSGGIWINGEKEDDYRYSDSDALYYLEIDGGSGRVSVDFK